MILVNHKKQPQCNTNLKKEDKQKRLETKLEYFQPDEPPQGELKLEESETEALAEDDPTALQEGLPMRCNAR